MKQTTKDHLVKFPLADVAIRQVVATRKVGHPTYADSYWQMNQHEFAMQVEGVGHFYACKGNEVEFAPNQKATLASLELYLNGSVYGAILHQRQILPLHGSSMTYNGRGIMICGESGAGKSSVVAAFSLSDAEFLTDDVTPVIFKKGRPHILGLSDRIKLWDNALEQLMLKKEGLAKIDPETEKFYFPMTAAHTKIVPLQMLFVLEIHDAEQVEIQEITGSGKFTSVRNEIYRWEYLQGMPDNEKVYFRYICDMASHVAVYRVKRPAAMPIREMVASLKRHIHAQK